MSRDNRLLRSRIGRTFIIFVVASAAISAFVGYGFYRSNVSALISSKAQEKETMIELVDSMVNAYTSYLGTYLTSDAPVPATFRARGISIFNKGRDASSVSRMLWVGIPGREIKMAPTDASMAEMVLEAARQTEPKLITRQFDASGDTILRTIYPAVARQQACVDCHNALQPGKERWRLNDVMGAFALDVPIGAFMLKARTEAIAVAVGLLLLSCALGLYIFRLQFRRVAAELASKVQGERERESLRALEEVQAASRAKSEFLAMMSHELRTPLNAIIGFSEMMEMQHLGALGNPRYIDYAKDIGLSGRHLIGIIGDILDTSKVEAGKLDLSEEDVDLDDVLRNCARLILPRAEAGAVAIVLDLTQPLRIRADRVRVRQIVFNLLGNAVKFTPQGGRIVIATRSDIDRTGDALLMISDTGIGIAAADIPKALTAFGQIESQQSRKFEGTGLGLPLSKALIELHGGSLSIESQPGRGTTVTVRFPRARVQRQQLAAE